MLLPQRRRSAQCRTASGGGLRSGHRRRCVALVRLERAWSARRGAPAAALAARARCIEHEQGKAAVAGDESSALGHVEGSLKERGRGRRGANYFTPSAPPRLGVDHLIIPRSELSTNRISISTSSP